ncbi:MAG: VanZ family protein, partial [Colwellia sp.]|nr:VanZ family protein [Colwellia sp.]
MRLLIAFVYFLIAYGSLFPFHFYGEEFSQNYANLLSFQISGIGDVLGNILLFIPLGFLYALMHSTEQLLLTKNRYSLWVTVFIFALSLQILQIGIPERDQNIVDVVLNLVGFLFGYKGILLVNAKYFSIQPQLKYLPIAIALTYVLSELSPFVPSIDFQVLKDSFKPLLILPSFSMASEVFSHVVIWLVVIRLLSFQQDKIPIKAVVGIWLFMLSAKVVIVFNVLALSDVIAPLIAIALVLKINLTNERATKVLLGFTVFVLGFSSLASFGAVNLSVETLFPFQSYLNGQLYSGIQALLFKLFIFSAIIWLAIELRKNAKAIASLLAVYVLIIECLQLFMPSRVTDFGDVLLVAIAYLTVRHLGDYLVTQESQHQSGVIIDTSDNISIKGNEQFAKLSFFNAFTGSQKYFTGLVLSFVLFYIVVNAALALPGIPYNIVELFEHQASLLDLLAFYLFLLLLGGGSFFIVQRTLKLSEPSGIKFIGLHVLTLAIIFICLYLSVTVESIEDIVGASKLSQILYRNQTSEHFFPVLMNVLSLSYMAKTAQFFEFLFRFSALYGLVQIPLTISLLIFTAPTKALTLVKYIFISMVLLLLSLYVTFYAAVTDNLTELIVSPVLLCFSFVLLSFCIALQWYFIQIKKFIFAITLILVVGILSWFIAQYAFELEIVKYGYIFSAFDFLIGAGREHRLSEIVLMIRWSIILIVFQLLLLVGLFWASHLPSTFFSSQIKVIKPFYIYTLIFIVIFGYVGNRLFGEHLHWQTLAQYFTQDSDRPFPLDRSVVQLPNLINSGAIYLNDKPMENLDKAFSLAKDYDTIRLSKGYYQQAGILKANNVSILAEDGAVIFGKTKEGKGALVIRGDNTYIEGLECHSIYVPDNNGVCIRLEGKGITLNKVYFHHAQGGLLGSKKGGDIIIENSRFEHLGDGAFYHGIYTLAPSRLFINNSYFLNNRNGGHEIKSRSTHTEITNSVIASSQSRDSRLIDVPNGGVLIIKNNILIEGPFSENHDLLSWGVEGVTHLVGKVVIEGNTIISDKS